MHRPEDLYPFWRPETPEFPSCRPPDLEQLAAGTATTRYGAWRILSITEGSFCLRSDSKDGGALVTQYYGAMYKLFLLLLLLLLLPLLLLP